MDGRPLTISDALSVLFDREEQQQLGGATIAGFQRAVENAIPLKQ
jgi:hypothetical protein